MSAGLVIFGLIVAVLVVASARVPLPLILYPLRSVEHEPGALFPHPAMSEERDLILERVVAYLDAEESPVAELRRTIGLLSTGQQRAADQAQAFLLRAEIAEQVAFRLSAELMAGRIQKRPDGGWEIPLGREIVAFGPTPLLAVETALKVDTFVRALPAPIRTAEGPAS